MFEASISARGRQVLSETDLIVAQDRKLTLRLLKNLHEIERNRLYLILAFSSMFDYCTRHLKYSEPSALRRIRTARCLARYPQLLPLLESGDVNPTTVSMVARHMEPGNAQSIIDAIRGKSRREVERFVAGLQPLNIIPPDRVRAVVVPVAGCAIFTSTGDGKKSAGVEKVTSSDRRTDDREAPPATTADHNDRPQLQRMARVEFTAHEALMQKLDRIRSLASHRLPSNASLEQLIDFMADYVIHREDPIAREQRREARAARVSGKLQSFDPRRIPVPVRDQVFVRDKRCAFVGPNGTRCQSTHVLQVDHIQPVARGGASTIDNLRLLCAYHNRLEAERVMGPWKPHGAQ